MILRVCLACRDVTFWYNDEAPKRCTNLIMSEIVPTLAVECGSELEDFK